MDRSGIEESDNSDGSKKLETWDFYHKTLGSPRMVVAPMVDASELAWRLLSRRHGAQLCYSPMYHASVFIRDANYRRDALATTPEDRPLIIQFCANKPDVFLTAAKLAAPHCDAVDLNLGCPQMIAKRGHYGAFLQDEWELLYQMVSTCHKELSVPITCKVRVYTDIEKTVRYAQMLEKAGCQLLTVHGRTKEQKGVDTNLASWEHIKAVREAVSIPVVANGNIQYYEDVQRCIDATGVVGVMSAEGNLHNPALFSPEQVTTWDMASEYLELYIDHPCPLSYIRGHMFKLFHHPLQVHLDLREVLAKAKTVAQFTDFILTLQYRCKEDIEKYAADPTSLQSKLPLPYWICQPYVRPGTAAESEEEKQKRKAAKVNEHNEKNKKRPLEAGGDDLSINKQKRQVCQPDKDFKPKNNKPVYIKCLNCGNPKGNRCEQNMCKLCCRVESKAKVLNCEGHRLWFKTWQEKQKENEQSETSTSNNVLNENSAPLETADGSPDPALSSTETIPSESTSQVQADVSDS